tara:strand:+ start:301 stop:474 length:174 start_codon:yes stop_codon:yes gene_type:complete
LGNFGSSLVIPFSDQESNLVRFGPAITPTSAKRTRDRTPTSVAERLPSPKAKVKNDK